MANLDRSYSLRQVSTGYVAQMQLAVFAGAKIYMGAMVCARSADGYAVRAGTAGTGRVLGIAQADAAIPTASGDVNVNLLVGQFIRPAHATRPPTQADTGKAVYASDDNTISIDPADGPLAGILIGFEATSNDPIIFIEPADAAFAGQGGVRAAVYPSTLVNGTPMAAFADNAASAPGVTVVDSKEFGIRWNNAATQVAVFSSFQLPRDLDASKDARLVLKASKTGATLADATTFTIGLWNNATGALHDADADYGGVTTAMIGNAPAKTVQEITRTILAADLGAPGDTVTISFKPTDGTLGTDDVTLIGIEFQYRRKA